MPPATSEAIASLEEIQVTKEPETGLFSLAEDKPPVSKQEISQEAREKIEAQQAEALRVFRQIPQEIESKFGNMVLERVFPELQLDTEVIVALKEGKKIKSNVTGELLTAAQMRDHWILPRGEQISKSTGAIYFPEQATKGKDLRNSFLFWEFGNVKSLLDSQDPVAPKVGIDTERGDISQFDKAYMDVGSFEGDKEEVESGEAVTTRVSSTHREDALMAQISEPYIPRHPETQQDVYKITRSETDSKLPQLVEEKRKSLAEDIWGKVGNFFPGRDYARQSPEGLMYKYPPALISPDLIILNTRNPEAFKYMAFAKSSDELGRARWERAFISEENPSAELTDFLAKLERRDGEGKYVYGYHTAALTA